MIGGLILERCLHNDEVAHVTVIVRKSLGLSHPRLTEVLHSDFLDFSNVQQAFQQQNVCYYCIGVYTGQVPAAEFKKITVDFTKVFAETLKAQSPDAVFCFLSGDGADQSEKSRILFAREKGKAENILMRLQFKGTYIFRPGYIYPVTKRKEPNLMYRMIRVLWKPFLSWAAPGSGLTSVTLADVMTQVGLHGADKVVFSNSAIKKYPLQ